MLALAVHYIILYYNRARLLYLNSLIPFLLSVSAGACMVVVSSILCGNLPTCVSTLNVISNKKLRPWLPFKSQKREKRSLYLSRPVVKNLRTGVTSNSGGNGSIESARVLLEQLFAKTQNLESTSAEDSELSTSLEVLRSEFEAALSTLRKRETDLKDAERRVSVEERTFKQTKLELERREREIAASFEKQEQLKVELEAVRLNFANQVRQIRDLQYLLRAKDDKLVGLKSTIMEKSAEIEKIKVELEKKDQVVVKLGSVVESKEEKLIEFEKILKDKEATIINLKLEIERKEIELADSNKLRELNEHRLKIVERELEDQTSAWLNARNEFQELKSQASGIKEPVDDFVRVRCLLDALRSELASSRELLASSHAKVELQANQLEEQSHEISQQRKMLLSYSENLESIKLEVDSKNMDLISERAKLTQLELQVTLETSKVKTLEEELARERDKLEEKSREVSLLTEKLEKKQQDFDIMQNVFQIRESELAEARVQIQSLESGLGSVTSLAERKDKDLVEAKKMLEGVNDEIIQLRKVMDGKEEQFVQLMSRLHEKEEHIVAMQDELREIKMRHAEATLVVHELTDLTTNVVGNEEVSEIGCMGSEGEGELNIRLEMEVKTVKETLREKEVELVEAQRQLVGKEEELKSIRERWKEREKESKFQEVEIDGLRELYSLVQGSVVTEKLEMELVQVEAETTRIALQKITELTENIVTSIGNNKVEGCNLNLKIEEGCFEEAEKGIFRLFSLTEQLVGEAQLG